MTLSIRVLTQKATPQNFVTLWECRLLHFLDFLFTQKEEDILLVGHFTLLWGLFSPPSDHFVLGARGETNCLLGLSC